MQAFIGPEGKVLVRIRTQAGIEIDDRLFPALYCGGIGVGWRLLNTIKHASHAGNQCIDIDVDTAFIPSAARREDLGNTEFQLQRITISGNRQRRGPATHPSDCDISLWCCDGHAVYRDRQRRAWEGRGELHPSSGIADGHLWSSQDTVSAQPLGRERNDEVVYGPISQGLIHLTYTLQYGIFPHHNNREDTMIRSTISTYKIFQMFPDQETARMFMEQKRWPDGPQCPHCHETERSGPHAKGYYRCNACKEIFTVRIKTVMERSHIPLHKWICGMYLMVTARKGVSSVQLAKELGIRQSSAWFMLQRLREACRNPGDILSGIVEIDECYMGGRERNRHESKKTKERARAGKIPVLGMRERTSPDSVRKGRVIAETIEATDREHIHKAIIGNVGFDAMLHTDDYGSYLGITPFVGGHKTVNHRAKQFVKGDVHTNGIESVWAVLKRGVYHQVTAKHLQRYVNEFTFRLNQGACANHTLDRIDAMFTGSLNKRLTYKDLIQ